MEASSQDVSALIQNPHPQTFSLNSNEPVDWNPQVEMRGSELLELQLTRSDADNAASTIELPLRKKISTDSALLDSNSDDLWAQLRSGFKFSRYNNSKVERQIKRLTQNPNYFIKTIEKGATYLPYFIEQLELHGLPSELALLPFIESGYNPRVYSVKGAAGLWQFMPATAKQYGLNYNWWYAGRRDITASTNSAITLLKQLQQQFNGNWPLVLAAYNAGPSAVKKAIRANLRQNKPADYDSLKLSRETRNFYPKLIAVKKIIANPEAYNIELPSVSPNSPFEIVEFDFQVDLNRLAHAIDVKLVNLALLNPGLRRYSTPPSGPHRVLVPSEKLQASLDWKQNLMPGEAIESFTHVVRAGDTLSEIANVYHVEVGALMAINAKSSTLIRVGEQILVPKLLAHASNFDNTDHILHNVIAGDSLSLIAHHYNVKVSDLRSLNDLHSDLIKIGETLKIPNRPFFKQSPTPPAVASINSSQSQFVHTVSKGESLWSIARSYGVRVKDLIDWNGISRNHHIYPAQQLIVNTE